MKKAITAIAILLATTLFIACKVEDENRGTNSGSRLEDVSFKRVDLSGAHTLALASPRKTTTKADGDETGVDDTTGGLSLLYIMDDNGQLKEVEYTLEIAGDDGVKQLVSTRLKLVMEHVYSIGAKWLWMFNCGYYFEGLEEIENATLRDAIIDIINGFGRGHSFLVRKTDGALFTWDDDSNPYVSGHPWQKGDLPSMSDEEAKIYIKSVGEDIVTASLQYDGFVKLYCLYDDGNVLTVKKLLNDDVYAYTAIVPVPGEDAFLFRPTHVEDHVVMFTKTGKMKLIGTPAGNEVYGGSFVVAGNKLYRDYFVSYGDNYPYYQKTYYLYLERTGETFYLFGNYCTLNLKEEDTIYLRAISQESYPDVDRIFRLTATDDDPMCFRASEKPKKTGTETGLTLSPGRYGFFIDYIESSRTYLYVDNENNRTHFMGPAHFFYPISVDAESQTVSWGELQMTYLGPEPIVWETPYTSPVTWTAMSGEMTLTATLDIENRTYSEKTIKFPDGFPRNTNYIDGCAYEMIGNDSFCIYSLETQQKEIVPVIWSEMPVDVVGEIVWIFNYERMMFWGQARTLEGDYVNIYIPVTGENRGVARITVEETHGAGETVTQLIRLN